MNHEYEAGREAVCESVARKAGNPGRKRGVRAEAGAWLLRPLGCDPGLPSTYFFGTTNFSPGLSVGGMVVPRSGIVTDFPRSPPRGPTIGYSPPRGALSPGLIVSFAIWEPPVLDLERLLTAPVTNYTNTAAIPLSSVFGDRGHPTRCQPP